MLFYWLCLRLYIDDYIFSYSLISGLAEEEV